jgi:hypothetical protein
MLYLFIYISIYPMLYFPHLPTFFLHLFAAVVPQCDQGNALATLNMLRFHRQQACWIYKTWAFILFLTWVLFAKHTNYPDRISRTHWQSFVVKLWACISTNVSHMHSTVVKICTSHILDKIGNAIFFCSFTFMWLLSDKWIQETIFQGGRSQSQRIMHFYLSLRITIWTDQMHMSLAVSSTCLGASWIYLIIASLIVSWWMNKVVQKSICKMHDEWNIGFGYIFYTLGQFLLGTHHCIPPMYNISLPMLDQFTI